MWMDMLVLACVDCKYMDGWLNEKASTYTVGWMDGRWMHGWTKVKWLVLAWIYGWQVVGRMDGWMDGKAGTYMSWWMAGV